MLVKLRSHAKPAVMGSDEYEDTPSHLAGRIMGAKMRAETARQETRKAARAADRAVAEGPGRYAWKAMAGQRSHFQQ